MSDNAIRRIQAGDLRKMSDREGLILQGCGGDPQEWLEGINEMLTDAGILRNGSRFERASLFEYDGHTNMLFDFEGVDLDVGKLAMWRLTTYGTIGGTWLSDYVPNRLGGFLEKSELGVEKPLCPLIGQDGNIFNLRHCGEDAARSWSAGSGQRTHPPHFQRRVPQLRRSPMPDWGICDDHRHWRLQSQPPRKGEG